MELKPQEDGNHLVTTLQPAGISAPLCANSCTTSLKQGGDQLCHNPVTRLSKQCNELLKQGCKLHPVYATLLSMSSVAAATGFIILNVKLSPGTIRSP